MTRADILRRFVHGSAVLDRHYYRSADNGDDMSRDDNAIERALVRAEQAGDVALHVDEDGDAFATLTTQGRAKIDRMLEIDNAARASAAQPKRRA